MSVFYKFKSAKEYDTVNFEGNQIPLGKLKQAIVQQSKLSRSTDFDLVVENAQTGEEYSSENTLIPKNTSVIVKRVPVAARSGGSKIPGIGSTSVGNPPLKAPTMSAPTFNPVTATFAELSSQQMMNRMPVISEDRKDISEEDKLKSYISQNTADWLPDKTGQHFQTPYRNPRIPPPNYVCHRCNQPGHYIQHCPTNGDPKFNIKKPKKPTGIPRDFLKPVANPAAGGAGVLLMPGGGFAYMEPNESAFKQAVSNVDKVAVSASFEDVPASLRCPICDQLLKNAVMTPCCFETFCDSCITSALIDSLNLSCPKCKKTNVSVDQLIPNKKIRESVEEFRKTSVKTVLPEDTEYIPPGLTAAAFESMKKEEAPVTKAPAPKTQEDTMDQLLMELNKGEPVIMRREPAAPQSVQAPAPQVAPAPYQQNYNSNASVYADLAPDYMGVQSKPIPTISQYMKPMATPIPSNPIPTYVHESIPTMPIGVFNSRNESTNYSGHVMGAPFSDSGSTQIDVPASSIPTSYEPRNTRGASSASSTYNSTSSSRTSSAGGDHRSSSFSKSSTSSHHDGYSRGESSSRNDSHKSKSPTRGQSARRDDDRDKYTHTSSSSRGRDDYKKEEYKRDEYKRDDHRRDEYKSSSTSSSSSSASRDDGRRKEDSSRRYEEDKRDSGRRDDKYSSSSHDSRRDEKPSSSSSSSSRDRRDIRDPRDYSSGDKKYSSSSSSSSTSSSRDKKEPTSSSYASSSSSSNRDRSSSSSSSRRYEDDHRPSSSSSSSSARPTSSSSTSSSSYKDRKDPSTSTSSSSSYKSSSREDDKYHKSSSSSSSSRSDPKSSSSSYSSSSNSSSRSRDSRESRDGKPNGSTSSSSSVSKPVNMGDSYSLTSATITSITTHAPPPKTTSSSTSSQRETGQKRERKEEGDDRDKKKRKRFERPAELAAGGSGTPQPPTPTSASTPAETVNAQ